MTDRIIRPSNLGKWSACARKTYANIVAPVARRGVNHVSQWVGDAAHRMLSGEDWLEFAYGYMLYDTITPNLDVAKAQANEIAETTLKLISAMGFEAVAWEVPVTKGEDVEGTIDVLLKDDVLLGKFVVGDLKTGQRIPAGTWLQLGQYFDAYDSMPDTNLGARILLLHVPRTPPGEPLVPHTEFRHGPQCAAVASEWVKTIAGWVDRGTLETVLPSPGYECSTCELTVAECPVRIERNKS